MQSKYYTKVLLPSKGFCKSQQVSVNGVDRDLSRLTPKKARSRALKKYHLVKENVEAFISLRLDMVVDIGNNTITNNKVGSKKKKPLTIRNL